MLAAAGVRTPRVSCTATSDRVTQRHWLSVGMYASATIRSTSSTFDTSVTCTLPALNGGGNKHERLLMIWLGGQHQGYCEVAMPKQAYLKQE